MTRLACVLVLLSLVTVVLLALDTNGGNSILFTFVGVPLLVAGVAVYVVQRWREGAFRVAQPSPQIEMQRRKESA